MSEDPIEQKNKETPPDSAESAVAAQNKVMSEFLSKMTELITKNTAREAASVKSKPESSYEYFVAVTSSGLFFMVVGSVFLFFAFLTVGRTYAAMSFVFVVIGVAVLLYGTGTQGIGSAETSAGAEKVAKYKVALAGGAGIIAFCVAAGMIQFYPAIKKAFQIEQNYLRVGISGRSSTSTEDLQYYVPEATVNNNPVPVLRQDNIVEVYIPYMLNEQDNSFTIHIQLRRFEDKPALLPAPFQDLKISLVEGNQIEYTDDNSNVLRKKPDNVGGYDFPNYLLEKTVSLVDDKMPRSRLGMNTPE